VARVPNLVSMRDGAPICRLAGLLASRFFPCVEVSFYPVGFTVHRDHKFGRVAP
jgi:hypothetical protein